MITAPNLWGPSKISEYPQTLTVPMWKGTCLNKLYMDVQPISCLPYGQRLGENDRNHKKNHVSILSPAGSPRFAHKALTTLAITNSRPLSPESTNPDYLYILTPPFLTQKVCTLSTSPSEFDIKDLYKC